MVANCCYLCDIRGDDKKKKSEALRLPAVFFASNLLVIIATQSINIYQMHSDSQARGGN